jgi:hypothetical protein
VKHTVPEAETLKRHTAWEKAGKYTVNHCQGVAFYIDSQLKNGTKNKY